MRHGRIHLRIAVACLAVPLFGCGGSGLPGSGVAKTETRDLSAFDQVQLSGIGRLEITVVPNVATTVSPDGKIKLEITADDNLLPLINTSSSAALRRWTQPFAGRER